MSKGALPGQRPGGRRLGTPNRRSILVERQLAIAERNPTATAKDFLGFLMQDQELPANTRIAIGRNAAYAVRDIPHLLVIVQDKRAIASARRKAALEIGKILLPKKSVTKRWGAQADQFGFTINPHLAKEYRDIGIELAALGDVELRSAPVNARRIKQLKERQQVIWKRLECPPPDLYGMHHIRQDEATVARCANKRKRGEILTEQEDVEEAHAKARFDSYDKGPEVFRRRVMRDLADDEDLMGIRLSPQKRWVLRNLEIFYPRIESLSHLRDHERDAYYRRRAEEPPPDMVMAWMEFQQWWDGNYYGFDSRLRPTPEAHSASLVSSGDPNDFDPTRKPEAIEILKRWLRGDLFPTPNTLRQAGKAFLGQEMTQVFPDLACVCVSARLVRDEELATKFRRFLVPEKRGPMLRRDFAETIAAKPTDKAAATHSGDQETSGQIDVTEPLSESVSWRNQVDRPG